MRRSCASGPYGARALPLGGAGVSRIPVPGRQRVALRGPLLGELLLLGLVLAVLAPPAARGAALDVALPLVETAGVARRDAPATVSVPLPAGAVRDAGALRVVAGDRPVASQPTVLERWPDGSVRWLLLDLLASLPADGRATLALRAGAPARAAGPAVARRASGGGQELDTGAFTLTVPGDGAALATSVRAGGTTLVERIPLPALTLATGAAAPVPAGPPTVETDGPVRTELLLRGSYGSEVAYEARVAAFAGQPVLRLQLTLTHMGTSHDVAIRGLALDVPGTFDEGALGVDGAAKRFASLVDPHVLRQLDGERIRLDDDASDGSGDGWTRAVGDAAAVTLVARWFREEWPKALTLSDEAVQLDLLGGGEAPVALGRGAAKTFEAWIVVEPATKAMPAPERAATLLAPLVGMPPAPWIVASGALPQSLAPEAAGAPVFLERLDRAYRRYRARNEHERWDDGPALPCEQRTAEHPRTGFTGALNWGDWNFPGFRDRTKGCDAWGNLEYDLTQVLGLGWATTAERVWYDGFVAAARHYRDVDVIHHDPENPDRVGLNHPHKMLHFAPEAKQNVDLGHTWLEGLITHWRITGEVRSRDAALAMGDALARRVSKASNPRHFGWPMIALGALAAATNEARYRDAAVQFAAQAVGAFPPTPAAADWKIGILADGLAYVEAVAPDAKRAEWLQRYADAYVAEPERWTDPRYALPLAWLGVRRKDARYEEAALAVAETLEVGDWGKTLALNGRTGFRLLGPLAAAGVKPRPAPRPAKPGTKPVTSGRDGPPRASAGAPRSPSPSPSAPGRRRAD